MQEKPSSISPQNIIKSLKQATDYSLYSKLIEKYGSDEIDDVLANALTENPDVVRNFKKIVENGKFEKLKHVVEELKMMSNELGITDPNVRTAYNCIDAPSESGGCRSAFESTPEQNKAKNWAYKKQLNEFFDKVKELASGEKKSRSNTI